MRILILDDSPARHSAFARQFSDCDRVHCWSASQAIAALEASAVGEGWFDIATLDHDLDDLASDNRRHGRVSYTEYVGDGKDVARYIAKMTPLRRPGCTIIHSWNVDEAKEMARILRSANVRPILQPFGDLPEDDQSGPVELKEEG